MKSIPHPYVTSRKVTRGMKDYRGDKRENHSYFTHSFANDGGSGVGVVLHMADEEAHNSGMEESEEEKNDCRTLVDDTSDRQLSSFLFSVSM